MQGLTRFSRWTFAFWILLAGSALGAEQSKQFRLIGLFSPDREQDLRDLLADVKGLSVAKVDYAAGQATFSYDLPVWFPGFDPKKPPADDEVERRLSEFLNNRSLGTFSLKPMSVVPPDKVEKVEIPTLLLDCKGCRFGAYLIVTRIEGVEHATVEKNSVVTAWIDPGKTSRDAIEAALKQANVELLKKH